MGLKMATVKPPERNLGKNDDKMHFSCIPRALAWLRQFKLRHDLTLSSTATQNTKRVRQGAAILPLCISKITSTLAFYKYFYFYFWSFLWLWLYKLAFTFNFITLHVFYFYFFCFHVCVQTYVSFLFYFLCFQFCV